MPAYKLPIQEYYVADTAICYGCGRHNPHGLHIKTWWDGEIGRCEFTPKPEHTAFPGVVYGGLIACLIDCHSIGTAIAAMYQFEERPPESDPVITCVTGNLNISYLKPTYMDNVLTLESTVKEIHARKAIIHTSLRVEGIETVTADVIAVRVQERQLTEGRLHG